MLHLKFALNLENLADEMIEAVSASWKSPFQAPIIIFPDPKLEQWFRLYWVKKRGTLVNFNSMMIDKFLMKILCFDDNTKKKLNADLLRNVIWKYLYSEPDTAPGENLNANDSKNNTKKRNYQLLGDEVTRYLETEGKLDEQHLFDLCNKMASLFMEYETSRPAGFIRKGNLNEAGTLAEGILDRWKQGNLRDFFDGSEREKWQRTLYSHIFHEQNGEPSLLTKAFDAANRRKNEGKATPFDTIYLTIPFLFMDCMENHGEFHCEQFMGETGPLPVSLFGLTGMGQFYRVILQKFAEKHDIFAYIQNPCMEFWEDIATEKKQRHNRWESRGGNWRNEAGPIPPDVKSRLNTRLDESAKPDEDEDLEPGVTSESENALLCYWGKSGRDNIKLWCQSADYDFEFEDGVQSAENLPTDSLLHKVQYMVANRKNDLPEFFKAQADESFTLTAAPTKEREMEALHTRIAKLLSEKDSDGNPVNRVSDILVFSPNLDDYRTAIFQAFDQSSTDGALHIPFSIVDSPARASLTAEAVIALFAIQQSASISRPAFFSLIRNPVVQATRHISEDDVSAWEGWIEGTNAFRIRNGVDDWAQSLQRLLAARFSTHVVDFGNSESLPYADMMSANSASLNRFADCVSELEEWIKLAQENDAVTPGTLDKIATYMNDWISMPNAPEGFNGETVVYQNMTASLENLRIQYDAGAKDISWACVSQTLSGAAQSSEYSCGNLFVNGITFSKFVPSRIIPVKHLFFIGADSMNFPGSKTQNTLDLRKLVSPWPGDDSPVAKRRYAFLCQLMCTKESFHISYMNQNIVKDEELYPSSVVNDIRNFFKNAIRKSAENSGNSLTASEAKKLAETLWPQKNIPLDETRPYSELFSTKEFRNKAVYNKIIEAKEDLSQTQNLPKAETKLPERVTFYQLKNFLDDPFQFRISQIMESEDTSEDPGKESFEPIDFDRLEQSSLLKSVVAASIEGDKESLEKTKNELRLKGKLPDGKYGEKLWKVAQILGGFIIEQMKGDAASPYNNKADWTFNEKIELPMVQPDNSRWTLLGTLSWCNKEHDKIVGITTSKMAGKKGAKFFTNSKYTSPYIAALALIAQKPANKKAMVEITIYSVQGEEPSRALVEMEPSEAKGILSTLYSKSFQQKYAKAVPVDLLGKKFDNFDDYASGLSDAWKYFEKRHLFNKRKDVGFDPINDFGENNNWEGEAQKQKELFKIQIAGNDKEGK